MHSAKYLAAAAFAGFAAAQTCTKDIEISEATPSIDCEVVDADITVDEDVAGALVIDGPEQIKGNLIINNATGLISIQSNTINSIGGRFELKELNSLNTITMDSLRNVNELEMEKLTSLRELTFGSEGVTKASKVRITDTFLNTLSGFMLSTVESLQIDNNGRLARFDSDLVNITDTLIINNNGRGMEISMDKLESASEIQIANVKSFSVSALETVDASLKLDECDNMESFAAPNLTKITDALAFINNRSSLTFLCPCLRRSAVTCALSTTPSLPSSTVSPSLSVPPPSTWVVPSRASTCPTLTPSRVLLSLPLLPRTTLSATSGRTTPTRSAARLTASSTTRMPTRVARPRVDALLVAAAAALMTTRTLPALSVSTLL